MDNRRRTDVRTGHSVAHQPSADINTQIVPLGRELYGQPITRVDFFRRMPTGGGTAYFKPVPAED
ncbi:hypothetical protein HFP15_11665 [Amycolatopsis sp. K13G38]|uniref:Uncharacterized protein n=1 Tax=Amycolatopsis acididurans TaxID=2724524 RepID=A0ABX1J183_9PSEU|nr:hypothetical protein [Amycolatopsis acididurans]NKQ53538.1 hypothetical protein [Amycolatopsis acididurans]